MSLNAVNISGEDNYDIHVASCKRTTASTHGGQKGSGESKGKKTQGSRPHEEKQRILDRITRNADKLYEAQFPAGDRRATLADLSDPAARAIVCRRNKSLTRRCDISRQ